MTPNTGALNAHLNLWMAAGGLRGTLMDGGGTGLTLTGVTDPLVVGTSSVRGLGAKGKLSAADAMVTRLRLGPVLAWTWGGFNPCIPGSRAIDRSAGSGPALPRDGRLPGSRLLRLPLLAATAGLRPPHHPGRVAANSDGYGNDDLKHQRLEIQISYGLSAFSDRLHPHTGVGAGLLQRRQGLPPWLEPD